MIHRKNIITVDADLKPSELFKAVIEAKHTRVPVWRETPDNIVGVLHIQDVVREFVSHGGKPEALDLLPLMTPPWFVPDTTTLEEQLRAFRERRSHFALVVDEYGALQGVITFADILDEIFGDIPDEHEAPEPRQFRPNADGSFTIVGTTPVRDLNRDLDWNLPDEEATTIAGLVIHEARTIPDPGQRFAFYGYEFEVLRRQRNQITMLRVIPPRKDVPALASV
jgi:Mg2+/Co2+ transporter CorB